MKSKKKSQPRNKHYQIRARFNLPKDEYDRLKDLKRKYNLELSQICQILLIKSLKNQNVDIF